jgi:ubiquinone/menaquinone biosynthesis C-methylase UbiE
LENQMNYGNWVRKKNLAILGLCVVGAASLFLIPLGLVYDIIVSAVFIFAMSTFLFPLYSYIMFSQNGGRFQEKIYNLIIENLGDPADGCVLDIGSGNGVLAVSLAQRYPNAEVIGIDYWSKDWEYSRSVCEKNASIAGVDSRVHFQKGDAAQLEFPSESFDGAISNLTFHEVRSVPDKKLVLLEALRVIKPGGRFVFVDYFYEQKNYGIDPEFEQFLKDLHLTGIERKSLRDLIVLPVLLKHPKILGKVGLIFGEK